MNALAKNVKTSALLLLVSALFLSGCKPENAAPAPLSAEQIPAEMQRAFANANPETKQLMDKMLEALKSTNYPDAYQSGQAISRATEITKEQLLVTARAMLGINALLQNASTAGDQNASAFIDYQRHNR